MGIYVNPPADGFEAILKRNSYIDKSELIAYTNYVLGTDRMLTCSTRPRRFGKSFAVKMLTAYYSKGADARSIFENLRIARLDGKTEQGEDIFFEKYMNKQDVISLDMTPFVALAAKPSEIVSDMQKAVIEELREEYPDCIQEGTENLYKALIRIHQKTGRKFFIIIDEWDMVFRESKDDKDVQKEYINLLRSLFKSNQTSQILVGGYMTGILPIKKYGSQSALTDFREFTMLKPGVLAPFIGFTEAEVADLCKKYDLDFDETRKWYDGYRFDGVGHIYCPNSIMELVITRNFDSYWTETETYESLRDYIDLNLDGLRDGIVDMLGGQSCRIDIGTFQNDLTSISGRDDIFTLLVHLGYLAYDFKKKEVFIPNEEVRGEFIRAIRGGRRAELARAVKISDKLLNATIQMDEELVAELIGTVHMEEITLQNYNNEQALRYVVLMAYLSCMDHYLRFEELAGGRGFSDILFLPRKNSSKPALLIELKWNKSADKAIGQIHEKQYNEVLKKFDYTGELLLVGINYSEKTGKHTCKIERFRGTNRTKVTEREMGCLKE